MKYGADVRATDNLATLSELTEAKIVSTLQERFAADVIYTRVGDILIACNPFRLASPSFPCPLLSLLSLLSNLSPFFHYFHFFPLPPSFTTFTSFPCPLLSLLSLLSNLSLCNQPTSTLLTCNCFSHSYWVADVNSYRCRGVTAQYHAFFTPLTPPPTHPPPCPPLSPLQAAKHLHARAAIFLYC
jgi:hypothetical protein